MLIRGGVGLGIILFAVWVYCLLDVIMADEYRIRNLSKGAWILIVLFTFEVGAVAWLVAGRPQSASRGLPYKGNAGRPAPQYPEYDRPGRFAATHPDEDEAFLRQVRQRAEERRRVAREQGDTVPGPAEPEGAAPRHGTDDAGRDDSGAEPEPEKDTEIP